MRLSIIIPYYDSDARIGALLDDLLDQDIPREDYEIFVVDDGSPEEPVTLKRYAAQYSNVVYWRQENAGVSVARNTGIDKTTGKWIFFCDSDDRVRPQALGKMMDIAEAQELDMLTWNLRRVSPEEQIPSLRSNYAAVSPVQTGMAYMADPPADDSPSVSRYIVQRELLMQHGLRFQEGIVYEDSVFRLDVMLAAQRVAHVDVDVYFYIQRETSILHGKKQKNYEYYARCLKVYLERLTGLIAQVDLPASLRKRFMNWRDIRAFYLLKWLCLYSPISLTQHYLDYLHTLGAWPLPLVGKPTIRMARWAMNHPRLWLSICRLVHLLPTSLRQRMH